MRGCYVPSTKPSTPPGVTWQMLADRPAITAVYNYIERMNHRLQVDLNTCFSDVRATARYDRDDIEAAISLVKWTRGIS